MRLICLFDLPVENEVQKRQYRKFHKLLMKNGFQMLQYSVYIRTCPNRIFAQKYYKRIEINSPQDGHIRLLTVTEKQYEDMILIIGQKAKQEEKIGSNRMVIL